MRALIIFFTTLLLIGCASFNPHNFKVDLDNKSKLPELSVKIDSNGPYEYLINDFLSKISSNHSVEPGDKFGTMELKVMYVKERRSAVAIVWLLPSLLSACTLNLLGYPMMSYGSECQIMFNIYDAANNQQKKYYSKASSTVYCAMYWGYSLTSEDRVKASNAKAIKHALQDLNEQLAGDLSEINKTLISVGNVQQNSYNKANSDGSIADYEEFLNKYDYGELGKKARKKLIELNYELAIKTNTKESLTAFLNEFPESKYSELIKQKINSKDAEYTNAFISASSIKEFANLILNFPEKTKNIIAKLDDQKKAEQLLLSYPHLADRVIPIIESTIIDNINKNGLGGRFVIRNIETSGDSTYKITIKSDSSNQYEFVQDFEGDRIYLKNFKPRMSLSAGSIHRYNGEVKPREMNGITFIGDVNKLNQLTFAIIKDIGYVYLRGKGKVILPNKREVVFSDN